METQNLTLTQAAADVITQEEIKDLLNRQEHGDYGDVPNAMQLNNDLAHFLKKGHAMSVYELDNGETVEIRTLWNQTIVSVSKQGEII